MKSTHMMGPYELAAYRAGGPIRDIVRRGQHTLVRLYLAGKHQERLDYSAKALKQVSHTVDMCPPRTLGELCLELGQKKAAGELSYDLGAVTLSFGMFANNQARRELYALRRAMYHKPLPRRRLELLIDHIKCANSPFTGTK